MWQVHVVSYKLLTFLYDRPSSVLSMQKRDPLILVILLCIWGGVFPFYHAGSREQSGTKVRCQACDKHLHLLSHPQLSLSIHHKALNYFNIFLLGKISWPLSRLLYILSRVLALLLVNKRHLLWTSQDSVGFLPPYSKPHDNFPTV